MKKIISIILLFFISCNSKELEANNGILKLDIIKLKVEVKNLKEDILNLKKSNLKNWISNHNDLTFYDPENFTIKLFSLRPSKKNNKFVLCVPSAFTDDPKNNSNLIDGYFIEKGNVISKDINTDLSGTCIIFKNRPIIIPSINLTRASKTAIENKSSLFQQFLLLYNNKIISNLKFEKAISSKRKLLRRAIVEINNHVFIVESKAQYSIIDFQNLLFSNKVKNAIYLDMGTYSEGWYENDVGKITIIGETMINTNKQSNWIVFEKI